MTAGSARRLSLIAFAAVAAGCGASSPSTSTSAVVPWLNKPIEPYVPPPPKIPRYPTSAPFCRASQLTVTQGRQGVGLGNRLEELVFTNTGRTTCLLHGYPRISGLMQDGARRRLPARHGGTYFGRLVPANVRPGRHVFLDFGTSNAGCRNNLYAVAIVFRQLDFRLPSGGVVRAGPRVAISEVCSIDMTTFGLPERPPRLTRPARGTPGTLRARLRLPGRARPGAVLRYSVTLVNATEADVRLAPCPGYTQDISNSVGASIRRAFRLNCAMIRAIPANESVRYAMRLRVPRGPQPGGYAKISWTLNTPHGPSVGGAVRVRG